MPIVPAYCTFENENSWRWMTQDGMFEAKTMNYYGSFDLQFHRWLGDRYAPKWERLHYVEAQNDEAKRLLTRAVEIGIEDFLAELGLSVQLPLIFQTRFKMTDARSVIRTVRKTKYKFSWKMNWGTPYNKTCPTLIAHWCGATISVETVSGGGGRKTLPNETFACCDTEAGWERFKTMISDPTVPLMEELL